MATWPADHIGSWKVAVVEILRIHLRPNSQKASQGQEKHTKGLPSGCAWSGFHSSTESLKRDSCTCQQESHSPAKAAQHPRVCSVWRDQAERKCFNSTHRCSLLKCFKSQITWGERHPYIWKTQIKTSNIIGKTHKNYNHIHHFTQ